MKETNKVAKAFILVLQIGLTMIVAIGLCSAVGYYVDSHFGTSLMIFFIAFGVISGYSGAYSLIKQYIDLSSSRDRYEQMFDEWTDEAKSDTGAEGGIGAEGEDNDEDETVY